MNMPLVSSAPVERARAQFEASFGAAPQFIVQAPGRVNLIGEHTDYNDGFVLPCAIDYHTVVAASPRSDAQVRVVAADYNGAVDVFRLDQPLARGAECEWADYVRGMAWVWQDAGLPFCGIDMAIAGNVPQGAGLSSSASLEVAVGQAFKSALAQAEPSPSTLARLAQRAENEFVGCQCGIMDQLISAQGAVGHALLIDCRSLETQAVAIPSDIAIMIVHSRVQRGLVDSEYNLRRQQCEAAALHFGVPALRDLDIETLMTGTCALDDIVFRRARHVVTENLRTQQAAEALRAGNMKRMGELMAQSHASMRGDFEITVPAIDKIVDILASVIGTQGGARMTGGGFGGCVVALLPHVLVETASAAIAQLYRAPNGESGVVYVCRPSAGASAL
jgi:galactokinase